jgi:hypothetical protein
MDLKENKKIWNFRDSIYTSGTFILCQHPVPGCYPAVEKPLAKIITDLINQMITITKNISYAKYANDRYLGLFNVLDTNNHMIALPVIPFKGTHCTYK